MWDMTMRDTPPFFSRALARLAWNLGLSIITLPSGRCCPIRDNRSIVNGSFGALSVWANRSIVVGLIGTVWGGQPKHCYRVNRGVCHRANRSFGFVPTGALLSGQSEDCYRVNRRIGIGTIEHILSSQSEHIYRGNRSIVVGTIGEFFYRVNHSIVFGSIVEKLSGQSGHCFRANRALLLDQSERCHQANRSIVTVTIGAMVSGQKK